MFRRNTLLECNDVKIVVSTVGNYISPLSTSRQPEIIGYNRYYETMAFHAKVGDPYKDADVSKDVYFNSKRGNPPEDCQIAQQNLRYSQRFSAQAIDPSGERKPIHRFGRFERVRDGEKSQAIEGDQLARLARVQSAV
jgi:hypothetical protein